MGSAISFLSLAMKVMCVLVAVNSASLVLQHNFFYRPSEPERLPSKNKSGCRSPAEADI